jgi:hypothetical protein
MRSFASRLQPLIAVVPLLAASCGGAGTPPNPVANESSRLLSRAQTGPHLAKPALIAIDELSGDLVYWEIKDGPSGTPITLTGNLGTYNANAMLSNGDVVIIASHAPPEIIEYNIKTKVETTLADPFGAPNHVAVDKAGTVYALGRHKIGVFPAGSSQPYEIGCKELRGTQALSIAVDNESDVFVAAADAGSTDIFELPAGSPSDCVRLDLKKPSNLGGIGIDPKTDDLVVVDNPGIFCSYVGRLTIYPKPYASGTAIRHNFYANYCAGGFRLDARSTHIYIADETVDESYPLIDVRSYPSGSGTESYADYSAYTGGFTLIPSALPN